MGRGTLDVRGTSTPGWGYGVLTMRAAIVPHLSPTERRAIAALALAGRPFAALTAETCGALERSPAGKVQLVVADS
jgi:hypothetical protein